MIDVIVLAGGKSSRYHTNKLAQIVDNKPLLYYTIQPFVKVASKVIIVTGHYPADYIRKHFPDTVIQIVHNDNYEMGMFSSVQTGIQEATHDAFVIPGDCPMVKPSTIHQLMNGKGILRVPISHGRKGHPIYLSQQVHKALINEPITSNLKVFRDRFDVEYIHVDDSNVLHDIDQQHDFKQFLRKGDSL